MVDAQSAESQVQLITPRTLVGTYLGGTADTTSRGPSRMTQFLSIRETRGLSRLGIAGGVVQEWEHTNKSPIVSLPICAWCPPSVLRPPGETRAPTRQVGVCVCASVSAKLYLVLV